MYRQATDKLSGTKFLPSRWIKNVPFLGISTDSGNISCAVAFNSVIRFFRIDRLIIDALRSSECIRRKIMSNCLELYFPDKVYFI